jgi:hypothetical protein
MIYVSSRNLVANFLAYLSLEHTMLLRMSMNVSDGDRLMVDFMISLAIVGAMRVYVSVEMGWMETGALFSAERSIHIAAPWLLVTVGISAAAASKFKYELKVQCHMRWNTYASTVRAWRAVAAGV